MTMIDNEEFWSKLQLEMGFVEFVPEVPPDVRDVDFETWNKRDSTEKLLSNKDEKQEPKNH